MMPPGRKKPDVALSKVPSIGELCNKLGFQRATPAETSVFTDTTHAFRKSYICTDGSPGSDLVGWYSISVQQELTAMAQIFLAERGNGERFWAEERRWKEDGDLTYPEDKQAIVDLLKQLFWKQNKYALNNQTYIERKVTEGRDHSRDNTSPIRETTLRASMASTSTIKPFEVEQQRTYDIASRPSSYNAVPKGPVISLLDDDREKMAERMQEVLSTGSGPSQARDIFEFPEDDTNPIRTSSVNQYASNPPSMRTPNKNRQPGDSSNSPGSKKAPRVSPSSKRPKITAKSDKNPKKRKLISPRRTSARQKISRTFPDKVPQEIVDEIIRAESPDQFSMSATNTAAGSTSNHPQHSFTKTSPHDMIPDSSNDPRSINNSKYRLENSKQRERPEVPVAPMFPSSIRDEIRPYGTYSIPSTISEPNTPLQRPSDLSSTPDPATAKPKPKARGLFWIITSPEPNYNEETWKNGQIKGKSLPDVIREISSITGRDGIEKLKIKLKTAQLQTTTTVQSDADDHWEFIKSKMEEKIRDAFARDREGQNHFHIWIEPIYGYSAPMDGAAPSEVEDFDW